MDAQAYLAAAPSYLVPGMRRFDLSRYSMPGPLQSRGVAVECAGGSLDATRSFAAADRTVEVEAPLEVWLDAQAYLAAAPAYLVPGARRFSLSQFSRPGTQVRQVSVDIAEATVDATRSFAAADRIAEVEAPLEVWLDAQAYRVADPSYLVPGARRFSLSQFSRPGTQVRQVSVAIANATVNATRLFTAAPRFVEVEVLEGALDAQAYRVADPSYLVPGARRFGLSRFSIPGTLQSRHGTIEGAEGTITATRDPLVAADRLAAIAGLGGYLAGRSYAVPDVSGGVVVVFEEVYPI